MKKARRCKQPLLRLLMTKNSYYMHKKPSKRLTTQRPASFKSQIILLNKPFQVLSQFRNSDDRTTLSSFISLPDFYPAGRLDYDSEGLLLLTNDGALQHKISHPLHKMQKTYWAQVEGEAQEAQIHALCHGVELKDGMTLPAEVSLINEPIIWPRVPPIRERKHIPTSWLRIRIKEGRNRQVRRMTAAVNLPTLRLIRCEIGPWQLNELQPGEHRLIETPTKFQTTSNPKFDVKPKRKGRPNPRHKPRS